MFPCQQEQAVKLPPSQVMIYNNNSMTFDRAPLTQLRSAITLHYKYVHIIQLQTSC